MEKNDIQTANYSGFSLVNGGLFYNLTSGLRNNKTGNGLRHLAISLVVITWGVMGILAIMSGTLVDDSTTIDFFEDFLFHVRFLLIVPFLVLIEPAIEKAFVDYIQTSDKLIPNSQQPIFDKLVKRVDGLTDSIIPEAVALIIIYSLVIINWDTLWVFDTGRNYLAYPNSTTLNMAGWYYLLICSPVFQLLVFRWAWRWIVWVYSVYSISRLKLHVDPLHADQMAGLEYLSLFPLNFSLLLIAPSAVLSAYIGIDIIYHGAVLSSYFFPIGFYVIMLPILLYLPMVLFSPFLMRAKSDGILNFGSLIRDHDNEFTTTWIDKTTPKKESILGSTDPSSLADINGGYSSVENMKLVPVNARMVLLSFAINLVPYIPLIFTFYSVKELIKMIISSVLG